MARTVVRLALLTFLIGCGAMSGPRRGSSEVLTREEIRTSSATTAYELLQQLRPQFLRSRGAMGVQDPRPVYPIVYLNDIRHGSLDILRSIGVEEILDVRFIGAADATTRWGTGHAGGVILIRTGF